MLDDDVNVLFNIFLLHAFRALTQYFMSKPKRNVYYWKNNLLLQLFMTLLLINEKSIHEWAESDNIAPLLRIFTLIKVFNQNPIKVFLVTDFFLSLSRKHWKKNFDEKPPILSRNIEHKLHTSREIRRKVLIRFSWWSLFFFMIQIILSWRKFYSYFTYGWKIFNFLAFEDTLKDFWDNLRFFFG